MTQDIRCSKLDRTNQNRFQPLHLSITYESVDMMTNFELPRKYMGTYHDRSAISIGHQYNSNNEVVKEGGKEVGATLQGKWVRSKRKNSNGYEIHLTISEANCLE